MKSSKLQPNKLLSFDLHFKERKIYKDGILESLRKNGYLRYFVNNFIDFNAQLFHSGKKSCQF